MSEAEQTEQEQPQEPPVEPGEPEPERDVGDEPDEADVPREPLEEPPPEQETQAMMEERGKRFEKLSVHVAKRTTEILGDDVEIVTECPLCTYWGMPGWIPTVAPPQDLQAALYAYLGSHAPSEYREDRYSRTCEACNGLGQVATGSQVLGQDKLPCVECGSNGWIPVGNERASGFLPLANGPTAAALGVKPADLAMSPAPHEEPPEVQALRAAGYVVVPPIPASA